MSGSTFLVIFSLAFIHNMILIQVCEEKIFESFITLF